MRTGEQNGKPTLETWSTDKAAMAAASARPQDGIYALATNLPGTARAPPPAFCASTKTSPSSSAPTATTNRPCEVPTIFLHNDDRIEALISIIGLALVTFGLIEIAGVRDALGTTSASTASYPKDRAARPTGRNILAAFQGLGLTYTPAGIVTDHLSPVQRQILALLNIPLPWPEKPA